LSSPLLVFIVSANSLDLLDIELAQAIPQLCAMTLRRVSAASPTRALSRTTLLGGRVNEFLVQLSRQMSKFCQSFQKNNRKDSASPKDAIAIERC
jgi:hypothetical protein